MMRVLVLAAVLGLMTACGGNTIEKSIEIEPGRELELVAGAARATLDNRGPGAVSIKVAVAEEGAEYGPVAELPSGERWRGSARGIRILLVNDSPVPATIRAVVSGAYEGMVKLVTVTRDQDVGEG